MAKQYFTIEPVDGKYTVTAGIGKMFFQDGFPISMAIARFKSKEIEVDINGIIKECMGNGWSEKTTYNKLRADFADGLDMSFKEIESFFE